MPGQTLAVIPRGDALNANTGRRAEREDGETR
jgi:hypothetical protein